MDIILQSAPKTSFNDISIDRDAFNSLVDMAKEAQETYEAIESPTTSSSKGTYEAIEIPQIKPSFKGTSFKETYAAIESPQIKIATAPSFAELPPQGYTGLSPLGYPPLDTTPNIMQKPFITKPTSPLDEETLAQSLKKQETAVKNKRLIKIGVAVAIGIVALILIVKHFKK